MIVLFSAIVRELRLRSNISQKELARAVFISPGAISQYEKGKCMPSRETLDRIARYFGVSVDYLLGTSANAELETLMNGEYVPGVKVSALLKLCMEISPGDREALLTVVKSLAQKPCAKSGK